MLSTDDTVLPQTPGVVHSEQTEVGGGPLVASAVGESRSNEVGSSVGLVGSVVLISRSLADTAIFADALAQVLLPGDVVLLVGDLGAGKTAFTKALGLSLRVDEPITSPTFTIMRTYEGALSAANPENLAESTTEAGVSGKSVTLAHLDAYRLEHADAIEDLGLFELLDQGAVAVIEWGDLVAEAFGASPLLVQIAVDQSAVLPQAEIGGITKPAGMADMTEVDGEFADREPRRIVCSAHPEGPWQERLQILGSAVSTLVAPVVTATTNRS